MTNNETVLSQDPHQAVEEMITITEELMARIEMETSALAVNDGTSFSMNEMDKEHVANIYDKAAAEFHARLGEFQGVEKSLMAKLENANAELRKTTANNIRLLEKIDPENKKQG